MTKSKTIYLAHSTMEKGKGAEMQKKLESMGIKVFNPFVEVEQETDGPDIFHKEMEAIRKLDGLVGIVSSEYAQWGTPTEVFWASYILRLPVFLLYPPKEGHKKHPFIRALAESYDSEEALLNRLEKWRDE